MNAAGESPSCFIIGEGTLVVPCAQALLDRGYALVGSSYERSGWTLDTAAEDQLQALEAFGAEVGEPTRVLAMGTSMGGLIGQWLGIHAGERLTRAWRTIRQPARHEPAFRAPAPQAS